MSACSSTSLTYRRAAPRDRQGSAAVSREDSSEQTEDVTVIRLVSTCMVAGNDSSSSRFKNSSFSGALRTMMFGGAAEITALLIYNSHG